MHAGGGGGGGSPVIFPLKKRKGKRVEAASLDCY